MSTSSIKSTFPEHYHFIWMTGGDGIVWMYNIDLIYVVHIPYKIYIVTSYPYPLYKYTPSLLFVMLQKAPNEPKQIRHFTHPSNDDGENGQGYFTLHPSERIRQRHRLDHV